MFGDTFVDSLSIVPGTNELLKRLADHYTLCVATGMNPKILKDRVIPKFNIPNVFKQVISAYDIKNPSKQKPDPYMIELILKTQNTKPDEAVLVGDAETDVAMARAANVTPIVVLTGHLNEAEAKLLDVKYIIKDVTRLENVLTTIDK